MSSESFGQTFTFTHFIGPSIVRVPPNLLAFCGSNVKNDRSVNLSWARKDGKKQQMGSNKLLGCVTSLFLFKKKKKTLTKTNIKFVKLTKLVVWGMVDQSPNFPQHLLFLLLNSILLIQHLHLRLNESLEIKESPSGLVFSFEISSFESLLCTTK